MKHSLQLKLSQHLTLTPQLQQSIRLLQLSTLELNQELEKFLADNPLLEREDGDEDHAFSAIPLNTAAPEQEVPMASGETETTDAAPEEPRAASEPDWLLDGGGSSTPRDDNDESDFPQLPAELPSLREHLMHQLLLTKLPPRDRTLVALLIDALDED